MMSSEFLSETQIEFSLPGTGIGLQTVKQLALHGAKVYMGARSESRAKEASESILSENHAIVNNAGIAADDFTTTTEGFESTIASYWSFCTHYETLPLLKATASQASSDVRVVARFAPKHNVFATIKDLSDTGTTNLNEYTSRKVIFSRYGASKLANILFTGEELQRRLDQEDLRIMALTLDPRPVATDGGMCVFPGFLKPFLKLVMKRPEKGALNQLFCATAKEVIVEPETYKSKFLTAPGGDKPWIGKIARQGSLRNVGVS
ncbi:NAD(P)-binding protein [Trichoderma compactum]